MSGNNTRWTDDPFAQPSSPEEKEWIEKRNHALDVYRKTGDPRPAVEIGLFPKRKLEEYEMNKLRKAPEKGRRLG